MEHFCLNGPPQQPLVDFTSNPVLWLWSHWLTDWLIGSLTDYLADLLLLQLAKQTLMSCCRAFVPFCSTTEINGPRRPKAANREDAYWRSARTYWIFLFAFYLITNKPALYLACLQDRCEECCLFMSNNLNAQAEVLGSGSQSAGMTGFSFKPKKKRCFLSVANKTMNFSLSQSNETNAADLSESIKTITFLRCWD